MRLLKQIPQKPLSFTIFALTLGIACYLFDNLVSLLNSNISILYWQFNNKLPLSKSLEPHPSLILTLLTNIRGLLMDDYHPYFYLMVIVFILHIAALLIQLSAKYFAKAHLMTLPETQQGQEFIRLENSFQKQEFTRSQSEMPNFNKSFGNRSLRYFLYFTFSYYLCQFTIGGLDLSRSIFVGAKNIPIQEHDVLLNVEQNPFQRRLLEEFQEKLNDPKVKTEQQDELVDRLTHMKKMEGAISVVVSQDGNKIFQFSETITGSRPQYALSGMDITDPLAIKYFPQLDLELTRKDATLVLSSDCKTLFLVMWSEFHIYSISSPHPALKYVSTTKMPSLFSTVQIKPSVALYEEKNAILIATHNLQIFDVSDIKKPIRKSSLGLTSYWQPAPIALLPKRKIALLGSYDGLTVLDLSDLKNPTMKNKVFKEMVFSISVTRNQMTAMIGIMKKKMNGSGLDLELWNDSFEIYFVDLGDIESSLSYRTFLSIDRLKSLRFQAFTKNVGSPIDMTMTPDSKYAYWACDKDYGFIDIEKRKASRFLAQKTINAIALVQNSKILLKADSAETNLYALYQNIQKNDSFIWKPTSISRLKLSSSAQVLTFKKNRIVSVINKSTIQIFNTSENSFSEISTIELERKPHFLVPSSNGKHLYIKTDEKTIQVYDISNSTTSPQKLTSIDFLDRIEDDFLVFPEEQMIFATQKVGQNTTMIFADIKNLSSPLIDYLLIESKEIVFPGSAKLILSPDGDQLLILSDQLILLDVKTLISGNARVRFSIPGRNPDSIVFSPDGNQIFMVERDKNLYQKNLTAFSSSSGKLLLSFPLPDLAGSLPLEVSSNGDFLYLSTPEHLMEINVRNLDHPETSRLMKLSLKQFSLTEDGRFIYAVIGDYLEILDLRSKYALTSFKEDFPLGASNSLGLQLLERTGQSKWESIYKKHKFITANFYKALITSDEDEPILSYSVLPNWINFDKETAEITIESRLPTHLGTYKMFTTGSFQLPTPSKLSSSLSFLITSEQCEGFIADLTERGYLDEERFLTARYSPYKKLTLSSQNSQYESQIRYFLRNYATGQEFVFTVSSSLFLRQYPSHLEIETQSPHYMTARIVLPRESSTTGLEIVGQFLQRTYSSSRSILNQNQTDLTLDGTFLNINDALAEVIIDIKDKNDTIRARIIINDNLNSPVEIWIDDVSKYFRINAKPAANSDNKLSIQSQVNKYSLVSGQSFSVNLHPKSYIDVNERPLEYSLLSTGLDWLEIRGPTLTGTPPRKFWSSQVNVTLFVSNEFKSERVIFTLDIGMSAVIVLQYVILYFGYLFSAYKMYQNLPKFYNILAQKSYRYPKFYQIPVSQQVTDTILNPIGFFGKEFENAELLMNFLKKHLAKNLKKKKMKEFINHFKDEQGQRFNKNKLMRAINQVLERLTFGERHSVKYYIQIDDDQKDLIHQIILDKILLAQINLSSEKQTLNIFKKIKDQWIRIVEQDDTTQPYFKVNRVKLNYALQNLDSETKRPVSWESLNAQKDGFLDITQSSVRSRYFSNSHLFGRNVNDVEESLLDSNLSLNSKLENVDIDLLELALQAHAFKAHHLNAQKEQMIVISKERKTGSSCFYKIKALLRYHLEKLEFINKENLGYGLKYVFQKDVLHFCGIPEPKMEYETLVVQILNKREMITREIYIFGAENKNRRRDHMEQVQEQL